MVYLFVKLFFCILVVIILNYMNIEKDFMKFAISKGLNSNTVNDYKIKAVNGIINPLILEERNLNVATLDVFSRLMYDHIIFLGTEIDSDVANIVNAQLLYLNSVIGKNEDIKIFINTPGGSCNGGLSIYDIMNFVEPDISTYCMGMAASMGSILVSSGTKGKRYALPNSKIMIHQVSSGIGYINTADLKIEYDEMKNIQNTLYTILSENTGQTIEQIEKDADRDHWFTAQEALEYGLIDEIITKKNKN